MLNLRITNIKTHSLKYVHTNIIAADWRSLADFYIKVFNCEVVPPHRKQSGAWLSRGTGVKNASLEGVHLRLPGYGKEGPTLEIYSYQDMVNAPYPFPNRKGLGHLAFEVEDVSETLKKVIESGGSAIGEVVERAIDGVGVITFIYARDPEGNIIEIQHWKK